MKCNHCPLQTECEDPREEGCDDSAVKELMTISEGDFVHYHSPHGSIEYGRVKSITADRLFAFVVYNCNEDWDDYKNYTGAHTPMGSLSKA